MLMKLSKEYGKMLKDLVDMGEERYFKLSRYTRCVVQNNISKFERTRNEHQISLLKICDYLDLNPEEVDDMISIILNEK